MSALPGLGEGLAERLTERVGALLGARPTSAREAQGGYTHALRVVLRLGDGRACFAKLATDDETAAWLRAEARVYGAVQAGFLPRVLAWDDDGSRPLLLLEDLSAALWPPPWSPERVERLRETLQRVARTPVPPGLPALESIPDLRGWSQVAADPGPFLGLGLCSPAWLQRALPALIAAEAAAPLAGEALLHLDVRSDNVCFRPEPALVDWNWAARGDARVDLAFWAPSLRLEGGPPPEALLPDEPGLAAWVSGFFAARAGLPAGPPPPRVRALQRAQLGVALPWAARALALAPPDLASAGSSGTMAAEEGVMTETKSTRTTQHYTEAAKRQVVTALEKLLGDTYALYVKTQGFHWNVVGPSFPQLHELFGTQYQALIPAIDDLAERIRALGVSAPGSFSQLAKLTSIAEEHSAPPADGMLRQLVDGNEQCSRAARAVIDVAQELGDEATADMAIGRVEAHDKAAWMLRATLQR